MLWMTAVNYDKQHRIKIWLNRRKKMHERTNEWMNIGTHLSIKSAIFNIGQKGEKFSNLQNENGPLNRYGIKKERARERETWSKSDEFVWDFKMGMAMALGKYFSHYPTFQQNNFKRTSIQIFTHRMLWKLKGKGSKKVNVLYIFTNLNWFYIGKNIHTHKHTHIEHTYPCHTGRVFYGHHLKWWNEWCCLGPPGCCIICFFFFAILKCTFRNAVFADDDGGNGGGGDGDEEILFAMLHVLLLFWTIVCKQF